MRYRSVAAAISLFVVAIFCLFYFASVHMRSGDNSSESRSPLVGSDFPSQLNESSPGRRRERSYRGEAATESCQALGVTCASKYFASWEWPENGSCVTGTRNGYPVPDARCTPGGIVPSVTVDTLRDPSW